MLYFLFADTETSGVSFLDSRVIEVAFILVDNFGHEIAQFEQLVNFTGSLSDWSSDAEKVHGISHEVALTHGCSPSTAVGRIIDFIDANTKGTKSSDIVPVGANCYFDYVMLQNMGERSFPSFDGYGYSYRVIDTNQLGLFAIGKNKLSDILCHFDFKIDKVKSHSALYDARLHLEAFKLLGGFA